MIIEFSVSNFFSYGEKQTLSFAASRYFKEMEEQNSFDTGIKGIPRLLHSISIYGANASGKTNLIKAVKFMKRMVLNSAKEKQEGDELDVVPFMLDTTSRENESEFEIIFIEDGIRYQYGFTLNRKRICSEWLYAYPEGRPQKWFEREYDNNTDQEIYEFGAKFLGGRLRQDWKSATRSNALFLSVAVQFNSEQLKPVYSWFKDKLRTIGISLNFFAPGKIYSSDLFEHNKSKGKVLDFLKSVNLGIEDIKFEKIRIENEEVLKDMPEILKKEFVEKLKEADIQEVQFLHKREEDGELIPIDSSHESQGTINLFSFAGPWLDIIANDRILFIDEIDSSLHPLIVHQLVRMLHKSSSKAQLIFTTHDTTILGHNIMRRDQVWFVEKDKNNASKLYPLSDFKVRKREALEHGYLRGRYGAIPLVKDVPEY